MAKRKAKEPAKVANGARTIIAFKIDADLRDRIRVAAEAQDRNISSMITHLIKVGLGLSRSTLSPDNILD